MSYINLTNAGSFKTNESYIFASNDGAMYFTARQPLLAEFTIDGNVFSNLMLEVGDQVLHKEGSSSIAIKGTVPGRYPRVIYGEPDVMAGSTDLIRYQHFYPEEKFVVVVNFSYKRGRLAGISFELHQNNGLLKPGLMSKTISIKANKSNPVMKLLKKARKDGASAITLSGRGLEAHTPNVGYSLLSNHEVLEVWGVVEGAKRRMEEEVLKSFGITL